MRYQTSKQDDGMWCVWDTQTDEPAEAHGKRCINLRYEEAVEEAETLNGEPLHFR
jgi:hypothetical protein